MCALTSLIPHHDWPGTSCPEGEQKTSRSKILTLEAAATLLAEHRARGKTISHCHGVFDLLHIGHIRHLQQARKQGDLLVVTLSPDRFVDKGPHRPAFSETLRAEALASLDCVDYVAINHWPTAEETMRLLRPDVYVKGSEYKGHETVPSSKIAREAQVAKEIGARLVFTEDIVFSSSSLVNRHLSSFPEEVNRFLDAFRHRHSISEIINTLDKMLSLNVLVLGDTIIDEYHYCDPLGKSSKDPVLAMKYCSRETFAGGVLAVANHVANFAESVDLMTILGEHDSYSDFIASHLNPKIKPHFVKRPGAPTLVKLRYLERYSLTKLLEVYTMDDSACPLKTEHELRQRLQDILNGYDCVIVADFGHGMISPGMVKLLTERAPFMAVNTQANAGNRGFHTIQKYPYANYVCLAEHEIRLAARDMHGDVPLMMKDVAANLGCRQFVVTRGNKGCSVFGHNNEVLTVPTFAHKTVDRVGAGDAFFAISALATTVGVEDDVLGFLGNIAGSLAANTIGNERSVDRHNTEVTIISLLK
jgi:rfaE bifunctional protein nucleotidyltransferase chain/domain